jgi:SAM-dependent methyltransferase
MRSCGGQSIGVSNVLRRLTESPNFTIGAAVNHPIGFTTRSFLRRGSSPPLRVFSKLDEAPGNPHCPVARRGCRIVALEMGANLARRARQNLAAFPRIEIIHARFEDWLPSPTFDTVLAITAWHWLDPVVRFQRAAAALKPGGILFEQIQDSYQATGAGRLTWPTSPPESIADARNEIEQTGLCDDVQVIRRLWSEEFTAEEHVAMMRTASDHQLMEPAKCEVLFAEMRRLIAIRPAGRIVKQSLTLLHMARKGPE